MCVRVQGRLSPLLRASPHPRPPRRSGSPESRRGGNTLGKSSSLEGAAAPNGPNLITTLPILSRTPEGIRPRFAPPMAEPHGGTGKPWGREPRSYRGEHPLLPRSYSREHPLLPRPYMGEPPRLSRCPAAGK